MQFLEVTGRFKVMFNKKGFDYIKTFIYSDTNGEGWENEAEKIKHLYIL